MKTFFKTSLKIKWTVTAKQLQNMKRCILTLKWHPGGKFTGCSFFLSCRQYAVRDAFNADVLVTTLLAAGTIKLVISDPLIMH